MRNPKVLIQASVLAVYLAVAVVLPVPMAHASTKDELAMSQASTAVEGLWSYVDSSGSLPDDQFYPQFADKAAQAQTQVTSAYQQLATTTEAGKSKLAVDKIRQDVGNMIAQLGAWRQAAMDKDVNAFETANNALGDTVDTFNTDIDAYNAAKDGGKTAAVIAEYASVPAIIFLACMLLFAWAVYSNKHQEDVAGEIYRRLRWQAALGMLLLLIGSAVPAGLYVLTPNDVSPWMWFCILPGTIALLYVAGRFVRVWMLTRRGQEELGA